MAVEDTLSVEFTVRPGVFDAFEAMLNAKRIKALVNRIDRILFGKKGSLATSIKEQGRGNTTWQGLSDDYRDWKREMRKSGKSIAGESPPSKVISDKLWIRTGKFLEFTQKLGNGGRKTLVFNQQSLLTGREAFYEVFTDQSISYWEFADEKREVNFFTKEDRVEVASVIREWFEDLFVAKLQGRSA